MSRGLTTDLDRTDLRPYFFWDEDVSIAELQRVLDGSPSAERDRLLAKLLREARDIDVWRFITVAEALPRLQRRVGRRYEFWRWLIDGWRSDGLLPV